MSLDPLVEIVHTPGLTDWTERNQRAFEALFGSSSGRYRANARNEVTLRAPVFRDETGVSFAAYLHPSNPKGGAYHGMSFVVFPRSDGPALLGLVIGTAGLSPDEGILGRPGHARKAQAICAWLNSAFCSVGTPVAWAKQDPTRIDVDIPENVRRDWSDHRKALEKYGQVVYALFRPTLDQEATRAAVASFLDLMFEERGHQPVASAIGDADTLRSRWFQHLMPAVERSSVRDLLHQRRFVILQGPPGTGKTKMAFDLRKHDYAGRGRTIQFHPNTTYESFIGGLAPAHTASDLGLRFVPTPGFLMEAAAAAREQPDRPYLLHIDEINRADLGKILGEAILLLEPDGEEQRDVDLAYDFGESYGRKLSLPPNLHIIGTMNSADRSIALVDVAVRRRFAFVSMWPLMKVVQDHGCDLTIEAFKRLLSVFVEHASNETFPLVPGHSYFLEKDPASAGRRLQVTLAPLLEEYLTQGYVSGFAEPVRGYLQWLRAL